MQIETVAVVSSALVAIAGIVVPWLGKGGDRKHELRMLHESKHAESSAVWWERREAIYVDSLTVAVRFRIMLELLEDNTIDSKDMDRMLPTQVLALTARMDAYGSLAASEQMQLVVGPLLRFIKTDRGRRTRNQRPQDVLAEVKPHYQVLAKTIRDELAAGPPPI